MKKIFRLPFVVALLFALTIEAPIVLVESGCTSTQQTVAYKSLYSVEAATTAAYDVYAGQVAHGKIPTNDVPRVSKEYNQFQADMTLAVALANNNTNALAPSSLLQESADLINIINSLKK